MINSINKTPLKQRRGTLKGYLNQTGKPLKN